MRPGDFDKYVINFEPSTYFNRIMKFYEMSKINFPFKQEDLTLQEWEDLSYLNIKMETNFK